MYNWKKYLIRYTSISILLCSQLLLMAQCPMCKMAAEANMKDGGLAGQGLNNGILYLLVIPYLLAGTLIYLYRRSRKQLKN